MRYANQMLLFCVSVLCALSFLTGCDLVKDDVDPDKVIELKEDTLLVTMNVAGEINVLLNDKIGGEASLNLEQPTHGEAILTENGTKLVYTPATDFIGKDSLVYKVCIKNKCKTAKVIFKVSPICRVELITYALVKNQSMSFPIQGNVSCTIGSYSLTSGPRHGTIVPDGQNFRYTPAPDFVGQDSLVYDFLCPDTKECYSVKFKFRIKDPADCKFKAFDDFVTIWENSQSKSFVWMKENDDTCGVMTAFISQMPAHGKAEMNLLWHVAYVPDKDYIGPDQVTYTICNTAGQCSSAQIYFDVKKDLAFESCRDKIAANPDKFTIPANANSTPRILKINLLANDDLCNVGEDLFRIQIIRNPQKGQVTSAWQGNNDLIYSASFQGPGTDTFRYRMCYWSKGGAEMVCKEAEVEMVFQ